MPPDHARSDGSISTCRPCTRPFLTAGSVMLRIWTPLLKFVSTQTSYSRMKSPYFSLEQRKLFGEFTTVLPTMSPFSTAYGAVPLHWYQPDRSLSLNSGVHPPCCAASGPLSSPSTRMTHATL